MTDYYQTHFKGALTLKELKPTAVKKLQALICQMELGSLISYSQHQQTLYINGSINNTMEKMENFMIKIFPLVDISDKPKIQAQGDSITDRYDLLYKSDGLYIQHYSLVKDDLVKYA